jgi:hypothetical protein
VPLGCTPLHAADPMEEVSAALPFHDSAGPKMLKLEEVIGSQLEAEGYALVEAVAEYALTCFQSWDPHISLESVVQGPIVETAEAASAGVKDTVKLVDELFEHQPKDT